MAPWHAQKPELNLNPSSKNFKSLYLWKIAQSIITEKFGSFQGDSGAPSHLFIQNLHFISQISH